jgi:hypothetical protein
VAEIPIGDIHADPVRFQFKQRVGQGGAGDELRSVTKFDPEKAGITSVWQDPGDGKTYVVNGHHRLELGKRTGAKSLTSRYLVAKDATEARTKGALINISEGRGESTDAAKVFRDSGMDAQALEAEGVSLKGAVAKEGHSLSKLSNGLFDRVVSGEIPATRGAVIGEGLKSHADQAALFSQIQKRERGGKRATNDEIKEMIRLANDGPKVATTSAQGSMFGDEELEHSPIFERAEVSTYIRKQLAGEKRLFSTVGTAAVEKTLGRTGNVIKSAENAGIAQQAERSIALYDKLSTHAGAVADAIDAGARELANGTERSDAVKNRVYEAVREHLIAQGDSLSGRSPGTVQRSQGDAQVGDDPTRAGQRDPARRVAEPTFQEQAKAALKNNDVPALRRISAKKRAEKIAKLTGKTEVVPDTPIPKGPVKTFFTDESASVNPAAIRAAVKAKLAKGSDSVARSAFEEIRPLRSRIADESKFGKQLMDLIDDANDKGENSAGARVVQLMDVELGKLSREQRWNLMETLDGRARALTPEVQAVADVARSINAGVVAQAQTLGVHKRVKRFLLPSDPIPAGAKLTPLQVTARANHKAVLISYRQPFTGRTNYFPHLMVNAERLKRGAVRKDVVQNIVRLKLRNNEADAGTFVDAYVKFMESGKRENLLVDHLVKSGQATNELQAVRLLTAMRKNAVRRQGSLEYSRVVNLPFYDPDPARVLPSSIASQSMRLAHIEAFGQDHQRIRKLVNKIRKAGADHEFVESAVKRILGEVDGASDAAQRLSAWLRWMNGFKLGLSAIPNSFQGFLNTLGKADVRAVAAGFRGVGTKSGRRFGTESGAILDSVVNEAMRMAGDDGESLSHFLKYNGFSKSEQLNRIFAANAGAEYSQRMLQRLKLDPKNSQARAALKEMGLDADKMIAQGALSATDVLRAAKKFSDLTQFRSGPQDMPEFASTTWGKVLFQFKSYSYNQFRLLKGMTYDEIAAGRPGRGMRALLVLALVFPLTGELINQIRRAIKGRKAPDKLLDRYFEDLSATGASAVLSDMMEAGRVRRGAEFIGGPTVGTAASLLEGAAAKDPARGLGQAMFRLIPLIGQSKYLHDLIFPKPLTRRRTRS